MQHIFYTLWRSVMSECLEKLNELEQRRSLLNALQPHLQKLESLGVTIDIGRDLSNGEEPFEILICGPFDCRCKAEKYLLNEGFGISSGFVTDDASKECRIFFSVSDL